MPVDEMVKKKKQPCKDTHSLSLSRCVCVCARRKKNLTVCSPSRLLGGRFCLSLCVLRWWQGWGLFRKYILPPRRVVWYTPTSRPSKVPGCSHWENRTKKETHAATNTKRYFAKQVTVWIFACFFVCVPLLFLLLFELLGSLSHRQ